MKKDDIVELKIESIGMEGEGVARDEGFVIFINGALLGEKIKAQIIEVKKNFARAKVIKVLEASDMRQNPKCPIFFRCGGCDLQHIKYEHQCEIKKAHIKNCIDKACKIDCVVDDVVHGSKLFGYRNKEQIPIRKVNKKACAGFYKEGSHTFVPFEKSQDAELGDCPLHDGAMQEIIDIIVEFINKEKISTYDEKSNTGLIRHLVVRKLNDAYSICLVINGDKVPNVDKLIKNLHDNNIKFELYLSINKKQTNVILGNTLTCVNGSDNVYGKLAGVKFKVNPNSFLQINNEIAAKIYERVLKEIGDSKDTTVLDLYSGIGILSNIMAKKAKNVIGIEIVKEAVEDANKLAKDNGNDNIDNICDDVAKALPKVINNLKGEKTIAVIDPPRKGCDVKVLDAIKQSKPGKIIYISCNPATLARDLNILLGDYEIKSITPYDMFPQTKHVECVVMMSQAGSGL